jgi:hypothetical protein
MPDVIGERLARREIEELLALAGEVGLGPEDFAGTVESLKKEEAAALNAAGLRRQLEYIFATYGPSAEMAQRAKRRVLEDMMDYAPPGKLVQCSKCKKTEFRSRAKRDGEGWACKGCQQG